MVKFASQMRAETLEALRRYAEQERLNIGEVIDIAVTRHLQLMQLRPEFSQIADEILKEDRELLTRLAK